MKACERQYSWNIFQFTHAHTQHKIDREKLQAKAAMFQCQSILILGQRSTGMTDASTSNKKWQLTEYASTVDCLHADTIAIHQLKNQFHVTNAYIFISI